MVDQIRVTVLYGGNSSEREVSLRSGAVVLQHLDPVRFEGHLLDLRELLAGGGEALERFRRETDIAFLALHGPGGEDGQVQGMLELLGIPYTGSGVMASAVGMDKAMTKVVYRQAGLPVARDRFFRTEEVMVLQPSNAAAEVGEQVGWPAVVKATNQGSSRGIDVVQDAEAFLAAWEEARRFESGVLVEQFVKGREFTVPVLGGAAPVAFPVVEIVPRVDGFFTFEAKYAAGGSDEIVPARLTPEETLRLQELGLAAHRALGCWGVSRTDVLLDEAGEPVLLETNTLPGMTEGSLLPKAVAAAGKDLRWLVSSLLDWALERPGWPRLQRETAV